MQVRTWLSDLRASEAARGVDHRELACYAQKLTPYAYTHLDAAVSALSVAELEMPASDFSEEEQRENWEKSREDIVRLLTGALDSVGRILTALGYIGEPEDQSKKYEKPYNQLHEARVGGSDDMSESSDTPRHP